MLILSSLQNAGHYTLLFGKAARADTIYGGYKIEPWLDRDTGAFCALETRDGGQLKLEPRSVRSSRDYTCASAWAWWVCGRESQAPCRWDIRHSYEWKMGPRQPLSQRAYLMHEENVSGTIWQSAIYRMPGREWKYPGQMGVKTHVSIIYLIQAPPALASAFPPGRWAHSPQSKH